MSLPSAPGQYSRENEQATRQAIDQALQQVVRTDVAITRLQFIDSVTNQVKTLTIQSGAVVIT